MDGDFDDVPQDVKDAKPKNGDDFEAMPKGDYDVMGVKHELKDKPDQGGKTHSFTFQIITGEYMNRKVFGNFAFFHPDAQKRAKDAGKFAALKVAVGETRSEGVKASDLLMKPLTISLGCFPDRETKELRNTINAYKVRGSGPAAGGGASGVPGYATATTQPASDPSATAANVPNDVPASSPWAAIGSQA